jgi:hypothetical protein
VKAATRREAVALAVAAVAFAHTPPAAAQARSGSAPPLQLQAPDSIEWRESGPDMAFATVAGDPSVEGAPYGLLARLEDGAWIPPHWHPEAKHILVLSGVLLIGTGASGDPGDALPLAAGGATTVPAETVHYEGARGRTVVLFYGDGPLTTTFVDAGG